MPRSKKVTEKENGKIDVLCQRNFSIKSINEELKRSRYVLQNYLKDSNAYGKKISFKK